MRIFFDTSILIAAVVEGHPAHALAFPWLQRVKAKADAGIVAAHSLAEMYAILTRLPMRPAIPPDIAREIIAVNVLDTCEVVTLSAADYVTLLNHLAALKIAGGAVYDALLLHAAAKAGVDQMVTLNAHDFRRIYPALADKVVSPLEG
ncbi:MAG: PIN domain-containing protein [Anaerolineae bacterium]